MTALILMIAGAFVYRMRGGMPPSFPRPLDQMLFALPYGAIAAWTYYEWFGGAMAFYAGAAVFGLTTWALVKGHGNTMDLGSSPDAESEWYEFLIGWLKPKIPLYWYDAVGLALSGLSYTLPAGILCLNPVLALSGAMKAPAYMLSKRAGAGTEGGELLTGALLWGALSTGG